MDSIKESGEKMPEFLKELFWYCDFSKLDIKENEEEIIIQIINYGNWQQWQWLFNYYGAEKFKEIINSIPASAFRERALKLLMLLLKINKLKYASRSHRIREAKNISKT